MPTYEYVCKRCGKRFDVFQSFSEKSLNTHDECGGELQKVFHAAGIIFKGSGFYVTDSQAAKNSQAAKSSQTTKSSQAAKNSQAAKSSQAVKSSETTKKGGE